MKLPTLQKPARTGKFTLPYQHQPVVHTPVGGSSCANCRWVTGDYKHCTNPYYTDWMGTDKLPGPADEVCSDWWEEQ